ncbi:hypothetical protein PanWU01x14_313080 [Parasponia andersonii]|uniref:Uncharacterized protein n=1 Tax=Parasponia andersonii TaxID=3476 RepID=A0A2P5APJ4_PARAD|nr:hypothetical protein PanWU01x14_313080 [Parasponia andersonii]
MVVRHSFSLFGVYSYQKFYSRQRSVKSVFKMLPYIFGTQKGTSYLMWCVKRCTRQQAMSLNLEMISIWIGFKLNFSSCILPGFVCQTLACLGCVYPMEDKEKGKD